MVQGTGLSRVWVFDEKSLEGALQAYVDEALTAYPHQAERIRLVAAGMRDFLYSGQADALTLDKGHSRTNVD